MPHEWPTCVPLVGHTWAVTNGHTGVYNNFPRGTHVFCLSNNPHGTHMKPMCVYHLYCPCWANVWLPLWGHTWAATNGEHWSIQQFSTWGPWVLPLKVTIWDPHKTHVCLPSTLPILGPCVKTFCEANVSCVSRSFVFCPSKHPHHRWSIWWAPLECKWSHPVSNCDPNCAS